MFCDENLVGDVMSGLKGFVVKFMIRMSQVFVFFCFYHYLCMLLLPLSIKELCCFKAMVVDDI